MKLGIALSGGGMRGVAHAGVLQAFAEHHIKIDVISGTSAGALCGVMYAAGYSPEEILNMSKEHSLISLSQPIFSSQAFAHLNKIHKLLVEKIPHNALEQLQIPVYVVVTNLNLGKTEAFSEGNLADIVQASCSIPVLFKPVEINKTFYVDGGVMNNMPGDIIRKKCNLLIGVNLIINPDIGQKSLSSMIKIAKRTFALQAYSNSKNNIDICDIVITPQKLKAVGTLQTKNQDLIFEIGYKSTMEAINNSPTLLENYAHVR